MLTTSKPKIPTHSPYENNGKNDSHETKIMTCSAIIIFSMLRSFWLVGFSLPKNQSRAGRYACIPLLPALSLALLVFPLPRLPCVISHLYIPYFFFIAVHPRNLSFIFFLHCCGCLHFPLPRSLVLCVTLCINFFFPLFFLNLFLLHDRK